MGSELVVNMLIVWCSIAAYIEQHLQANKGKGPMSAHIVVVAHGIFNSEFIGALLARRGTSAPLQWGYKGELKVTRAAPPR